MDLGSLGDRGRNGATDAKSTANQAWVTAAGGGGGKRPRKATAVTVATRMVLMAGEEVGAWPPCRERSH